MAERKFVQITVSGVQDGWKTFPMASWTNNTGADIAIKHIGFEFVGADQLVGEFGSWLIWDKVWPPTNGWIEEFGAELYSNPTEPVAKSVDYGADQVTVKAGGTISLVTNAGPVNLPGGGQSQGLSYVAVAEISYD